ncbi:MAG: hypothetical protein C0404_03060 [Verrucomicrobia bacterium]|nr:hypothetical protein [Verrucomicrobiota bacterium]
MMKYIEEFEQKLDAGRIELSDELKLCELYSAVHDTNRLYSVATKLYVDLLAVGTNVHPSVQYRSAKVLRDAGKLQEMEKVLDACLPRIPQNVPAKTFLEIARMYTAISKHEKTATALEKYLVNNPRVWEAWVELSSLRLATGKTNESVHAMNQAVRLGDRRALEVIGQNPFLDKLWHDSLRARAGLTNAPPPAVMKPEPPKP